ncbi:DUF3253 domain-containing protein [Aureimonas leprariae]|uniref:DUF3253 domain-containing protein n=1 Tax=Plantimonas leprariae TaxID=2615207 RepID=A0A7V7TUP1_9HYPH|nr:DUF3253 domain-containing protein [Aureimonas leprariae]KAB0676670.1 DUF3253 domain-containing protein [Aureimonas leprariae]
MNYSDEILRMTEERGPGKTVCPSEVARSIAGPDEKAWRRLMKPIRAEAVRLALAGRVRILRKGKPVDPNDFKGIYRLAVPAAGAGNSSSILPDKR